MKLFSTLSVLVGCVLVPSMAFGASLLLTDTVGDPNQVDVDPGVSGLITMDVVLETTGIEGISGIEFRLGTADGSGLFSIVSRTMLSTVLTDPTSPDVWVTTSSDINAPVGPDNLLNPVNDRDLGATSFFTVNATETVMTVTLAYDALIENAQYHLNVVGNNADGAGTPRYTDQFFGLYDLGVGSDYVVNVTPEPASLMLLTLGGLPLISRRRKAN